MGLNIINKIKDVFAGLRERLDRNFFIFLIFLVFSSLFWLLNELSEEAEAEISYPVKYVNLPGNKMLANDVPRRLDLKLQAPGYTLLRFKLGSRLIPMSLDMESYFLRQLPGSTRGDNYLLTREFRDRFSRRLGQDISILSIKPDTLVFSFDSIVRRKLAVIPNLEVELARQYMLKEDFSTNPDSIIVSGPALILDSLSGIPTEYMSFEELSSSVEEEVKLRKISRLSYEPGTVVLKAELEQFTEADIRVEIEAENVPDSLRLITFPDRATISCVAGLSEYDKLSAHLFRLNVDYREVEKSLGGKLQVRVAYAPDYVSQLKVKPAYVEFIIEKK